jgi:hypothetical protein
VVDAAVGKRRDATDRGHLDDVPAALLPQVWQGSLGDPQRTEHVGFDLFSRLLLGQLFDEPKLAVSGVVHHNVQATEMIVCLLDRREVAVVIGDVQPNRQRRVAIAFHQIVQESGVACRGGDLVATLQRGDRPIPSESAGCTRDKPDFFAHAVLQRIRRRPIPGSPFPAR